MTEMNSHWTQPVSFAGDSWTEEAIQKRVGVLEIRVEGQSLCATLVPGTTNLLTVPRPYQNSAQVHA